MQAALEHLIYLWKGCLSSFVAAGSLLMTEMAQGWFGASSPLRDSRFSWTESWWGTGRPSPLSGSRVESRTFTVSVGHGPLPSGWFWGDELSFRAEFSWTAHTDGPGEEYRVNRCSLVWETPG